MGAPAGLKLHAELAAVLGGSFLFALPQVEPVYLALSSILPVLLGASHTSHTLHLAHSCLRLEATFIVQVKHHLIRSQQQAPTLGRAVLAIVQSKAHPQGRHAELCSDSRIRYTSSCGAALLLLLSVHKRDRKVWVERVCATNPV